MCDGESGRCSTRSMRAMAAAVRRSCATTSTVASHGPAFGGRCGGAAGELDYCRASSGTRRRGERWSRVREWVGRTFAGIARGVRHAPRHDAHDVCASGQGGAFPHVRLAVLAHTNSSSLPRGRGSSGATRGSAEASGELPLLLTEDTPYSRAAYWRSGVVTKWLLAGVQRLTAVKGRKIANTVPL